MARTFYKMIPNPISKEQVTKIGVGKIITISLLILFSIPFFVYGGIKLTTTYNKVASSWAEIKFAYERPALVRDDRLNYEKKQLQFEQSLLNKPTDDQKIVDAVVKKIESKNDLK